MAADYAGAIAAIKSRFETGWVVDGQRRTPLCYVNGPECETTNANGDSVSWCLVEIVHGSPYIAGTGTPGSRPTVWDGIIKIHVMSPSGSGDEVATVHALAACEIFRNVVFYDTVTTGCYVRSGYDMRAQPRIDEGDVNSIDGNWFATTASIPFEYWGIS